METLQTDWEESSRTCHAWQETRKRGHGSLISDSFSQHRARKNKIVFLVECLSSWHHHLSSLPSPPAKQCPMLPMFSPPSSGISASLSSSLWQWDSLKLSSCWCTKKDLHLSENHVAVSQGPSRGKDTQNRDHQTQWPGSYLEIVWLP